MSRLTNKLIKYLDKLISLLKSVNEKHWELYFVNAKSEIVNEDFHGIELLLSSYGGMGSFNDLLINAKNNNKTKSINKKLNKIRSEIYILASDIKNNYDSNKLHNTI